MKHSRSRFFRDAQVNCNGCTACCETDRITLFPELGDSMTRYQIAPAGRGEWMIARNPATGHCWYLAPGVGCTIWNDRPVVCRDFDCVDFIGSMSLRERCRLLAAGTITQAIVDAALARMQPGDRRRR